MTEKPQQPLAIEVLKKLAKALAFAIGIIAILVGLSVWSRSEWLIDARRSRIRSEIAAKEAAHPWAGTYYRGDGLGRNELLSVSEREGFQYTNRGCLGLYGHAHGSAESTGSRVELQSWVVCLPAGQFGTYEVVNWGSRRYLVEPSQLLDFVNAVNRYSHNEHEMGMLQDRSFYLRRGDEEKEPEGKPALPAEYARLLLAGRIEGHVTAVKEQDTRADDEHGLGAVDIDLGLDHGAFQGMDLYLLGGTGGYARAELYEVTEHTSRGRVIYRDSFSPLPAVGWSATSRLFE